MAERYYTVKLTLERIQQNTYRSRLDSPDGSSREPGNDFVITAAEKRRISEFVRRMCGGGFRDSDISDLGNLIFRKVFAGTVLSQYYICAALAESNRQKLRIELAVRAEELLGVPWEYFYDGNSFLIKRNQSIVRVIEERRGVATPVRIRRLLVAVANPDDPGYTMFPAAKHISRLKQIFQTITGLQPTFVAAKKVTLEKEIRERPYDALYFIGHGRFIPTRPQGQLILEGRNRCADPLDAERLAIWISNPPDGGEIRFIYLNSCATAKTGFPNPFAGVAQRLMRDCDVSAVVAMQTDVAQSAALAIAQGFFSELARGKAPEQAVTLARTASEDLHSWGVPVIYTRQLAPAAIAEPALRMPEVPSVETQSAVQTPEIPKAVQNEMPPQPMSDGWPQLLDPNALKSMLEVDPDDIDQYHHYTQILVEAIVDENRNYIGRYTFTGTNEGQTASSWFVLPLVAVGAHEPEDFQVHASDPNTIPPTIKDFKVVRSASNINKFRVRVYLGSIAPGESFTIQVTFRLLTMMYRENDYDAIGLKRFQRGVARLEYVIRLAHSPVEPHCYLVQQKTPPRKLGPMERKRERGFVVLRKEVIDLSESDVGFLFHYQRLDKL